MITVQTLFAQSDIPVVPSTVERFVRTAMNDEDVTDGNVSVIFTNDEMLRNLKLTYWGKDEFTDVMAFRLDEGEKESLEGEIYISVERATENAKRFRVPVENELSRLIFHGSLHLLGYEDDTRLKKRRMKRLEDELLRLSPVEQLLKS